MRELRLCAQFFGGKLEDHLRVLVVGSRVHLERISSALTSAGHTVLAVQGLQEASEALLVQRFDAVLLGSGLDADAVSAFAAKVRDLDEASSAGKTAVLTVAPDDAITAASGTGPGVDGVVPETLDPEALTIAIARLASAVGIEAVRPKKNSPSVDVPILDIEELKAQVAYDDDLLVELIDLYFSERERQSKEMKEALTAGEHERLSRLAHTIKGSLGSLHALVAKANAQWLELAAKAAEHDKCEHYLAALEIDLDILEKELVLLRRSISSSSS